MGTATRTSIVGIVLVAASSVAPATSGERFAETGTVSESRAVFEQGVARPAPNPVDDELVEVVGASARQAQQVSEALDAFADAGLDLPPVVIRYSDDTDVCEGNLGTYRTSADGEPDVVSVCSKMRITLVHELAHAWDHHALDDERRDAFTAHWGLDNWNDRSQDWHDRASERAADTVAYTLLLEEVTHNQDILEFVCGYSVLTGHDLPEPAAASCAEHPTTPPSA